ncbi:MAG: hypothetical protein QMD77_04980 [Patescibacteria group bacterium]|nr:hypothetical protein [Patescibacteria group bacterium]
MPKPEDFIPNLLNSLRNHNLIEEPKVEILERKPLENGNHLVKIRIDNTNTFFVITNFDAKDIFGIFNEEEFNKLGKDNS